MLDEVTILYQKQSIGTSLASKKGASPDTPTHMPREAGDVLVQSVTHVRRSERSAFTFASKLVHFVIVVARKRLMAADLLAVLATLQCKQV